MTVGEHHALTSGVYCPRLVREWITEESSPELRHRSIEGSMVFADVSGFTKMSERLARFGRLGAESVTDVIGACFSRLLAEAYAYAGTLLQFGGDALLLFYRGEDHAARAASAALEMRRALRSMRGFRTEAGLVSLSMTVGVNSGHFDFFLVGDSHRQLVVGGQAASHLVELEGAADKGRILIGAATAAALPRANVGPGRGPGQLLRGHPPASRRDGVEFLVTGHDLSGFVPVGLRRAVAVDAVESEHRTATVAFVHFDGLDRAIEQDGADVAAERLHDLMAGVQRAIDDRGICFQSADIGVDGGKFYLSVGAPLGTGSDEEHMLLALREIVELEVGFPLRAGVNRGPVFTGEIGTVHRRTYTTMGDTVNLAARLMGKAPMGQVLATRAVLDRSQTLFETAELPPLMVKGKRHPVTAFAVGPPTGVRTPMTGDGLPLVGRERELAAFRSAVDDAAAGTGRLIEVVAEPGAGKSRLLEQFVADAGGLEVHQVSCRLYQAATPYFVFEELLGEVFDLRDRAGRTAVEHLRSLVRENDPTLEPWLSLLAVPFGLEIPPSEAVRQLDEEFRKQQLQTVVTRFLDRALARPLLLCIENTHWMDDASGDLLDAVLADLTDRPWLVVLTRRDGDGGYEPAARAPDERLALGPLGSAALEELVDAVAADTPLAPHVRDDLVRRCDGNPLFLLELLQAVLAGEDVHELPTSVEGLITARIDRLPADDRALLRQVSVLGAGFRAAYATSVAPPGLRTSVDDALRQLTDFLSVDPSGWVGFRHHLVRDVAYAGLPFRNRRELHGRVADSLLRRVGDQVEEEAPLLSLHCAAAHRHADAWRYSVMAGDQAHEVFANLDATRFYERALDAARHLPDLTPLERAATLE
ncbi:MAG: AAA family ATPase, partial [Acidimicrobiales bacterium]|nr:AAA family ATPase [Acidimicrobiales bacterium]